MVVTQDGGEPGLSRENLRAAAGGTASTVSQTARDKNLVFGSINVMRCPDRVHGLMRHIKTMDRHFDIVCLQDPPLELPFISTPDYSMWYDAGRELTEEDNPARSNNLRDDTQKISHVAFLVHQDLQIVNWRVKACTNHDSRLIATLHLATVMGDIHVHNVYNWKQTLDIDEFIETCTGQGAHLIFGDFNEHNRAWTNKDEPTTRAAAKSCGLASKPTI